MLVELCTLGLHAFSAYSTTQGACAVHFAGIIDEGIYEEQCRFEDPTVAFSGEPLMVHPDTAAGLSMLRTCALCLVHPKWQLRMHKAARTSLVHPCACRPAVLETESCPPCSFLGGAASDAASTYAAFGLRPARRRIAEGKFHMLAAAHVAVL